MGIFEAEVRRHTGEEDILTSRVFGTLEILDQAKFLIPILEQCGVKLAQETAPESFAFRYWKEVVPEDEAIITSTNTGRPVVMENNSYAGQAFKNIAQRLTGEDVPFIDLEQGVSIKQWVARLFK